MKHTDNSLPKSPDEHFLTGIIGWFAQNSVAANLLLVMTMILGIMSANSLRKEVFPSMEPDVITVAVTYDSGDAVQAEEGVALKIEDALETVSGIKRITSVSNASGSTVHVEKETDYQLAALLTDVKTKVDAIYNFPSAAEKPVISKAKMQDHALTVQLYGDADRATLQKLAEKLKTDLLAKSAIRDLSIKAKAELMISVEVDEAKLQAYGLTMSDVAEVINNESSTSLTTSLRNSDKVMRLKASEQAYNRTDFGNIVLISGATGSAITLADVATIEDTFADDVYTLSRYNSQNGMAIEIVMDEYSDITNIVEQANQVVESWHARGLLPQNVELITWHDTSVVIKDRLSLLMKNALTGIALVFIVLALFLNFRVAFWVAAGIPFVFLGTLFFMGDGFTNMTINEMTTFGFIMALGIVVDDAVVVGESIYTTRKAQGDSVKNTILGTMKVAIPTIFGVLTTVAAFVAMANISGDMGKIYAQFGTIVTLCLLLSLVESKLILPSHLAHLDTQRKVKSGFAGLWAKVQHAADAGLNWFNVRIYRNVIEAALKFRYAVILVFMALFVVVIGMPQTGAVRVAFFPEIPGSVINVDMQMQTDASFGQTHDNLILLENKAIAVDKALTEKYQANESALASIQVTASSDSAGAVMIELTDDAVYSSTEFTEDLKQLVGMPEGVKKLKMVSSFEMVDNFKVELKAWDSATVEAAGKEFKRVLQSVKGVSGIDDNLDLGQPQLRFELTQQGRNLGMNTAGLSRQLLQAFGGEIVQTYQRNKDEVKVRVRYPEAQRQTMADIEQARVRTPDGTIVPLITVANVISEYQQDEITRINSQRAIYITAVLDKTVVASNELVDNLTRDLLPTLSQQYPELAVSFAGEAEEQAETGASMANMFMVALLVIFALLAIPLKSYIQPLLIMIAIPFGIVGAILGHWWNDLTISILSLNGILALSGVVVNDSLLLVSRFNEIMAEGKTKLHDAIVEACSSRLRAVLLTSITTFAGLAPLLGETSMQAQFLIPAAASLGYGILFATVITLVLIPALLFIQHECKQFLVKFGATFSQKSNVDDVVEQPATLAGNKEI